MKIWIHVNGVQEGPFDIGDLPLDRIDASTPIWYDGLPDWMPISQAPATAHIFGCEPDAAALADARDRAVRRSQAHKIYFDEVDNSEPDSEGELRAFGALAAQARKKQPAADGGDAPGEQPSSYLGWSILMTALCCNPLAIVAILTGLGVRSKWNAHDWNGAKRLSEVTAWLVMICIVLSLMFFPVAMIMM